MCQRLVAASAQPPRTSKKSVFILRMAHAFSGAFVKLEVANDQGINTLYYRYLTHSLQMITEEVIKVKTRGRRHQRDVSLFLVVVPACAARLRTADYHASAEDWMCQVERSSSA